MSTLLGSVIVWMDQLWRRYRRQPARRGMISVEELDRTGLVLPEGRALPIDRQDDMIVARYPRQVGYSLWRAQEFSLFWRHRHRIVSPALDLGCGDGSFATVLFEQVAIGLDPDPEAFRGPGAQVYERKLSCRGSAIPLESGAVATVFSNSVLEHVDDLKATLVELHRILRAGGELIFTVPVTQFARDLAHFSGEEDSRFWNDAMVHRNLMAVQEWTRLLEDSGYEVVEVVRYQPRWFTALYRVSQSPYFAKASRVCWTRPGWWMTRGIFFRLVRRSITGTRLGGNGFFICRKRT